MKKAGLISALAVLLVVGWAAAAHAAITTTINFGNAPTGAHFVRGTPNPTCTVTGVTVTCNSYEIAGVGNTDASATLVATYSAIVDCNNPGNNPNNPIESHTTSFTLTSTTGEISPKNGRLSVPALSVSPTPVDLSAATFCPNKNWEAVLREGSLTLESFAYTLTFEGFAAPAITVTGP